MREILSTANKYKFTLIILLVLTLISFFLRKWNFLEIQDIWSNVCAGFATLIGTIFVIDVLLEVKKREEFKEAREVSARALKRLANMLVSYPMLGMGYEAEKIIRTIGKRDVELLDVGEKLMDSMLKEALETEFILKALEKMNDAQWEVFKKNFISIRKTIEDDLRFYNTLYPPIILGKIFKILERYENMNAPFEIFLPIYLNGSSKEKDILRPILIENITKGLKNYFLRVKSLRDQIDKTYKDIPLLTD